MFPRERPRRLRNNPVLRQMVRETTLSPADFIYPLFVAPGEGLKRPVGSMPGVYNFSIDTLVEECKRAWDLGVLSVILFGIPSAKDAVGTEGYADDGIVQKAIRALKEALPELYVITDVCLCEYTDHGHCGIVKGEEILNDPTVELLAKQAVSHAKAGADMVAPSDMMDGRVKAIREALDAAGFRDTPIMSYAAKYASAFYGPFRDAADSAPKFGDRRSHQMDPANAREALREIRLDIEEGADIVMVKPAMPYLDIIRQCRDMTDLPVAAYQVSGELALIEAAAANGWVDRERVILESLLSIKRGGADLILTYFAPEAAELLRR
ncbi:MAG: porphobilinogen synthase [Deltaproteobacteria bacterium]|nr:porphobilinogen synthase [Deltaproteobacteria bacterium]